MLIFYVNILITIIIVMNAKYLKFYRGKKQKYYLKKKNNFYYIINLTGN